MPSSVGSTSTQHPDPDALPPESPLTESMEGSLQPVYHSSSDSEKTVIRQDGVFDIAAQPLPPLYSRSPLHQLIGHQLDHFLIESLVGSGGMGAVYRGRDLRLDRIVAIKVVSNGDRGADAMRRFRIEAQSAAKLDHPNIARVYYVGETEQWSYIVFEFVEGTNLRDIVLSHGVLSVDEAICLTRQVAEALQHAHERRVVHRDIKPSNILLTQLGQAKIVDMGLARTTELDRSTNDLTASGVTLGTFDYISPEQAHDPRDADVRSDIYSLGCTLYFLLTGQPPFPEGTALQKLLLHGTTMPEDPRFFREDLSDSLIAILRKMMAKRPNDRYQEPNDLVNDLQTLAELDGLQWTMARDIVGSRPASDQRTWLESLLPLALCMVAIVGITIWLHSTSYLSATFQIPRVEFSGSDALGSAVVVSPPSVNGSTAEDNEANNGLPARMQSGTNESPRTTSNVNSSASSIESPSKTNSAAASEGNEAKVETVAPQLVIVDPDSGGYRSTPGDTAVVVKSLEEALSLANPKNTVHRIQLRTKSIRLKPISLKSVGSFEGVVAIESAPGTRCRWMIDTTSDSSTVDAKSWIQCDARSLTLQGIDLVWSTSYAPAEALFGLKPEGALSLKDTTITVQHDQRSAEPCVVGIDSERLEKSTEPLASQMTMSPVRITAQNLCVRGQCDWLRMGTPIRTELQVDNAWFAIAGQVLDLRGGKIGTKSTATLRMNWKNAVVYSLQPWMRLSMTNSQPSPIAIVRIARDCVFAGSPTLVAWDASACSQFSFWDQPNRIEELNRWIDLRGMDNAYDSASTQNLFSILLPTMTSDSIRLDGDASLLREERGIETAVRWAKALRIDPIKLYELTPDSFELLQGAFQPGFIREKLPVEGLAPVSETSARSAINKS